MIDYWFTLVVVALITAWVSGILVGRWVEQWMNSDPWPIDGEGER
jgi:hypothetical protein